MSRVLVIAGTDSGGGAGLLRDLDVMHRLGVETVAAVTAVTAQTDDAVLAVHHVPASIITAQINAAVESGVDAVKVGMVGNAAAASCVAVGLERLSGMPIVVDPVLMSSSGGALIDQAGLECLRAQLLPLARLITPNIAEAASLLGVGEARSVDGMGDHARALSHLFGRAVLVKGGHSGDDRVCDVLCDGADIIRLSGPRLTATMRGTGCALSSAIAANLAKGRDLVTACGDAKALVREMMSAERH